MKIFTLGGGFVSDHLPYDKILDRIHPHEEDIDYVLTKYKPDVIINCIGKTGRPNVDWCESHKSETYMSNVVLPAMVAAQCETAGIHFIQIGSGCIYFGESPHTGYFIKGTTEPATDLGWKETDFANPKSFYSKTKYSCDLLLGSMPNVTTLRIRMPISTKNNRRNLINKLAGYKQVIDIPNSVTFMDDLARCVDWIAKGGHMGIYHVTNPEPLTAAQVMREYQKYMPKHTFEIINEQQLDNLTVAKRSNCIIDASKLKTVGFQMTPSKEALEKCMADYFGRMYV